MINLTWLVRNPAGRLACRHRQLEQSGGAGRRGTLLRLDGAGGPARAIAVLTLFLPGSPSVRAMTARTFGRRGVSDGGISARRAALLGSAPAAPAREADEAAARRAAFVAEERARAGIPAADETLAFDVTPAAMSEAVWGTPKSLTVAYALWLVLGIAGAHRFYLGRPMTGALQALLGVGSWALLATTEYYPAFAGMAVALLWMSADAYLIRNMHARPPGRSSIFG